MTLSFRLLILYCCFVGSSAFAQSQVIRVTPQISFAPSAAEPMAEIVTLANYDSNKPAIWVQAPEVKDPYVYTGFGERFTLPGGSGYLDSIRIHFDSVSGDILQVGVFKDMIETNARGTFHLADYSLFGLIQRYELDISPFEGFKDFWLVFPTQHLAIPKEFHIGVGANQLQPGSDEYTSMFRLIGEAHYNQEPTIDSRSQILITEDFVNFRTDIFDGFFTSNTLPLGINFHIDAVVDLEPSSVETAKTALTEIYPNPVASGGELRIANVEATSSLVVYDVLGNEVLRASLTSDIVKLPALSPGVYSVTIASEDSRELRKLIVR